MKRKKRRSRRAAREKSMKAPNRMALDQLSAVQQSACKSGIEIRVSECDGSGSRFLHIMFEHYGTRLLNYWPSKGNGQLPGKTAFHIGSLRDALEVAKQELQKRTRREVFSIPDELPEYLEESTENAAPWEEVEPELIAVGECFIWS